MNGGQDHYLNVDGLRVRYRLDGEGPAVLLLHGWGGTIESWTPVFDELRRTYTVYAFDLPGFGQSDLPPHPWGSADYARLTLDVMDQLKLDQPHLIGHSFGGQVSIQLAATNPERVDKLILVCSAGVRRRRTLTARLKRSAARFGRWCAAHGGRLGERLRGAIYRRVQSTDYASAGPLRSTLVKVVNEEVSPLLPHIRASTLLVWGAEDRDVPLVAAHAMQRLIPNAHLVVLENAGHFPYLDQFDRFRLVVGRFLRDTGQVSVESQG